MGLLKDGSYVLRSWAISIAPFCILTLHTSNHTSNNHQMFRFPVSSFCRNSTRTIQKSLISNAFPGLSATTPSLSTTPRLTPFISLRTYSITTDGKSLSDLIDDVSIREYGKLADEYLETLSDDLEELGEKFPEIDIELTQGVLTLSVAPGKTYVLNKQPPNKQIWLSSPFSGPNRYDLIGGKWIALRDESHLTDLLESELTDQFGEDIELTVEQ